MWKMALLPSGALYGSTSPADRVENVKVDYIKIEVLQSNASTCFEVLPTDGTLGNIYGWMLWFLFNFFFKVVY